MKQPRLMSSGPSLFRLSQQDRTERRYLYLAGLEGLDRLSDLTAFIVAFGSPPPAILELKTQRLRALADHVRQQSGTALQGQARFDMIAEGTYSRALFLASVIDENLRNLDQV